MWNDDDMDDEGRVSEDMVERFVAYMMKSAREAQLFTSWIRPNADYEDGLEAFVRDRGRGFDRSDTAADRRGIAQSIEGRLARLGGSGTVESSPGEGTEVRLTLPLESNAAAGRGGT